LPDSQQQPVWHVIVLGALTCGVPYLLYWNFKTCRALQRQANERSTLENDQAGLVAFTKISPVYRTLGILIPIVQIYVLAVLVLQIINLHPDQSSFPRRRPILSTGLVMAAFIGFLSLARLPGAWFFLTLLSATPFAVVQHWLNCFWRSVEPAELPVRYAFSFGEMAAIIIGASVIGLDAAGIMMGIPSAK
jgi:Domain of unknown function (DUF4234)